MMMKSKQAASLLLPVLFLSLLLVSAGCVNRYEGCDSAHMDPNGPLYSCCIRPGDKIPDPLHPARICCTGTQSNGDKCVYSTGTFWSSWVYVALLAVIISALIVSLAYMTGSFFGNQMLLAWAKNELFQVMASAFIIGTLIGTLTFVQAGLASEIARTGTACAGFNCHIRLADNYLETVYNDTGVMAESVIRVNTLVSLIRSIRIIPELFEAPYFGITVQPFSGLGILAETLKTTLDTIMKIMMLLKLQQILLSYIEFALFPILLVMGIVLRTFFFTRKLGGLLIAIAIGLYLVYPMFFVIAHTMWLGTMHKDRMASTSFSTNIGSYVVISHTEKDIENVVYADIDQTTGETGFTRLEKLRQSTGHLKEKIGYYVDQEYIIGEGGFLEKTSILLVYATFIPFIALMVTIGFVRGLSMLLGGDVEIAGLTRIL
jgi:hypothetical protein